MDQDDGFLASQTGQGLRVEGVEALVRFIEFARSKGAVICNIETFEIRGEFEIPRIDLGLYQGGHEDYTLPMPERVARSEAEVEDIVRAIGLEGIECVFNVWSDDL